MASKGGESPSNSSRPSPASLPPAGIINYTDQYGDNNKPLVSPTAGLTSAQLNPIRSSFKRGQGFDWSMKTPKAGGKRKKPPVKQENIDPKHTCKVDPYYCDPVQTIPIPLEGEGDRYPYRYSSAGPSTSGRTRKEWDLKRCRMRLMPLTSNEGFESAKSHRGLIPANTREAAGFETSAMQGALQMFNAPTPQQDTHLTHVRKPMPVPKSLCEPTWAPFVAHSKFDQHVIETLYPNWSSDPLYGRRFNFNKKPYNPEEIDNWDEEWQKEKKKPIPFHKRRTKYNNTFRF